jgi:putative spermidine/putrescine transport system substrate-binding protein
MARESEGDGIPRLPVELSREDFVKYGLVGGATVFFLGAKSARSAVLHATPAPKNKPNKLVIRNWGDPWKSFFSSAAAKTFTAQTGIPVHWDVSDQFAIETKVRAAIRSKQRPPVDAEMNLSTNGYLAYVQKLSTPLNPKIATGLAHVNQSIAKAGGGLPGYAFLGMYSYGTPLMYRMDHVKASELKTWNDIFNSKLRRKIGLTQSYTYLTFPLAKFLGINPARDNMAPVWKKLHELKPNVYGLLDDTQKTNVLISGDAWVVLGLAGDGLAARKAGAKVGFAVPQGGMDVDRDVYYVLKNTPPEVQYYANVFVNHLVAAVNQSKMANTLGVTPVTLSAKLPGYMKKNPLAFPFTQPQLAKNVITPVALAAKHLNDWQTNYDQALK